MSHWLPRAPPPLDALQQLLLVFTDLSRVFTDLAREPLRTRAAPYVPRGVRLSPRRNP